MYTRLQRLGLCLSYQGTLNAVDEVGKDHDSELLEWVEELKSTIDTEQVMLYCAAVYNFNAYGVHYTK